MKNKYVRLAFLVVVLLAIFVGFKMHSASAATGVYSLGSGQSVDITHGYSTSATVYVTGNNYDYVKYLSNGDVSLYDTKTAYAPITLAINQKLRLTNNSPSPLTIDMKSKTFTVLTTAGQALSRFNLLPGNSVFVQNLNPDYSQPIDIGGINANIHYGADGELSSPTFTRKKAKGSETVAKNGSMIVTNRDTVAYDVVAPAFPINFLGSTEPADFRYNVPIGGSFQATNQLSKPFYVYIDNGGTYEFTLYNEDGSVSSTGTTKTVTKYVGAGETLIVTNVDGPSMLVSGAYGAFYTTTQVEPPMITKTLAPGKSIKVLNNSGDTMKLLTDNGDKGFQIAEYKSNGAVDSYDILNKSASYIMGIGNYVVITNPAYNGQAIKIKIPKVNSVISDSTNPALLEQNISPGNSVEVKNVSPTKTGLFVTGEFDYALYDSAGINDYAPNVGSSHVYPDPGERVAVTNTSKGNVTMSINGPYEAFVATARTQPVTFNRVLNVGETLKTINTSNYSFYITASGQHHYALYKKENNKVDDFDNPIVSARHLISKDEKIITTNSGNQAMTVSGPYDAFDISSRAEPALYKGYLNAGQSVKLTNTSPAMFSMYTDGMYDQASYRADDTLRSLDHDRVAKSLPFYNGERVTLTNSGSSQLVVLSPYDVTTAQSSSDPALLVKQLAINQSAEFINKDKSNEMVYFTGKHDLMDYDTADQPNSYYRGTATTYRSVDPNQRLAVMNTDVKTIDAYAAFELFTGKDRINPVTFKKTLSTKQSLDFTNKTSKTFFVYPTGTYDFAEYQAGQSIDMGKNETSSTKSIPTSNRMSITNTISTDLTVEGPYDAFTIQARTNPALVEYSLAPRQSVEAAYTGVKSGQIRLTVDYDSALFTNNVLNVYSRNHISSTAQIVENGERLAVQNMAEINGLMYGAYDTFKVTSRTNPVTFQKVLNTDESVDITNTQPAKSFNVYLNAVDNIYDYVKRDANGGIDAVARAATSGVELLEHGERIAITAPTSHSVMIEGSYDALKIANRTNPALVKKALAPGQSLEATNIDSIPSQLTIEQIYDMATYDSTGALKQYSFGLSGTPRQTLDPNAKIAIQNSDDMYNVVYGPFESFKFVDRSNPVTFIKTLSTNDSMAFEQNALNQMFLYFNGNPYDYAQYKANKEVREYGWGVLSSQAMTKGDRIVVAASGTANVTVQGSYDAYKIATVSGKPVTIKTLEIGESYSIRNISPGSFFVKLAGNHSYQLYNANGTLTTSSTGTTASYHAVPASSRLVVTNVDVAPITVYAPTEAIKVTQGDDLLVKTLTMDQTMKATNTSSSSATLSVDGKYDVAVYDASGKPVNVDRKSTGNSVSVPAGGYAILTGQQAANTLVNGNKDNFNFEDQVNPALSLYTLAPNALVKATNVHDHARTLNVGSKFSYWTEQGEEQTGSGTLTIGAGNTTVIRNTGTTTYELYSPYGSFKMEATTTIPVPVPPVVNPSVGTIDPADYDQQTYYADPVDTSTGAQIINKTMMVAHGTVDIPFQAQYYALLQGNGGLGKGWSHNFEIRLSKNNTTGQMTVYWNAFRTNNFTLNSDKATYTPVERAIRNDQLQKNANGTYTLTRYDGTHYIFAANGALQSMGERGGITMNMQYDSAGKLLSVTEPTSGAKLVLTYNAIGKVATVADQAGRTSTFTYDDTGRLITLTDPGSHKTTYTYNKNNQILTGSLDGKLVFSNAYDGKGRILRQNDGITTHQPTTFAYSNADGMLTTTITDRNGDIQKRVHNINYQLVEVQDGNNGKTSYTYDAQGNRTSITNALGQTAKFEYDSKGNLTKNTDPSGLSMTLTYDAKGNLLKATGPDGNSITSTYDANSRLLSTTDTEGYKVSYEYNDKGMLTAATDPRGGKTIYSYNGYKLDTVTSSTGEIMKVGYDAAGRMTTQSDAKGNLSQVVYNDNDQLINTIDPLKNKVSYTYDRQDNLASVTDARGNTTSYTYDANGQLTAVRNALGGTLSITYDSEGNMTAVTDPLGRKSSFTYDAAGRLMTETNAAGATVKYAYDKLGRPIEAYDALNHKMYTVEYDTAGNPVKMTDALGYTYTSTYNDLNQLTQSVDPLKRTTTYGYDRKNQLTSVKDAIQGSTSQTIDAFSQITQMVDANGNRAKYQYDLLGRLISEQDEAGGNHSYTYNNVGLLGSDTDKNGRHSQYSYDAAGNLSQFTDEAGSVSYDYDANGNITSVKGSNGEVLVRNYDPLNRVESFTNGDGQTISYSYDAAGQLTGLTYPDGKKVAYTYHANGRLSTVTDWAGRQTSYTYDANSRLLSTTRPDGTKEVRTYDAAGQVLTLKDLQADGTVLYEYNYTYDQVGQVTNEDGGEITADLTGVTSDVYGPGLSPSLEDVMIQSEGLPETTDNVSSDVQTDVYMQPTSVTADVYGTGDMTMTYSADNRLATVNGEAVKYDAEGNMLVGPLAGQMQNYTFDARNRLVEAGGVQYGYDNENHRTSMTVNGTTTKYVINPEAVLSQVLMETDASGKPTAWYVYGNGLIGRQDANGAYQSYHYDRRGSTIALTDAKGQLTDTYSYGTYGESLGHEGTTEQPFQYNGRDGVMTDPNGLYQMRARYYNPEIKRFVNRDVLSGSIDDGLTMNRYAYVNGNPISYIDPFGLSADGDSWVTTGLSYGADAIPYVGTVKGIQETITGVNYITGEQLSVGDRVANGVGSLTGLIPIPGAKYVGKYGTEAAIDAGSWVLKQFGKTSVDSKVIHETLDYRKVQILKNSIGENLASRKEIRQFKKTWGQVGVTVNVDKKGKVLRGKYEAGFDYSNGEIWIKKNPSLINLYHEGYHAEQWLAIGKDAYMNLSRLEREEYVFSRVMQNKGLFDEESLNHSKEYIKGLRK